MTNSTQSDTLKVPGATLYYEIRGSGPLLLMIPGGPTDAGAFAGMADALADRYTVVAYDPRGNSRSSFDDAVEKQDIDVHGDDAAALIASFGDQPVHVLGCSGGGQVGLNLTARHPGRVRRLVAHEPPCLLMLPDPSAEVAAMKAVDDTYRREGAGAAMQKFLAVTGLGNETQQEEAPQQTEPTAQAQETFARISANLDYFVAEGIQRIPFYVPDIDALRTHPGGVVVAIGEKSRGQLAYRTAVALAKALGTEPVIFPGNHFGYGDAYAEAFAHVLQRVLDNK
jgi:pimeloyl-ACP methyl ester carboxylesterase